MGGKHNLIVFECQYILTDDGDEIARVCHGNEVAKVAKNKLFWLMLLQHQINISSDRKKLTVFSSGISGRKEYVWHENC